MTSRPGERGRSKMARRLLAVGLTLAMGYTSGVLALGGCAGASWPSNGQLPERVVDKLTECGKKGPTPLESMNYDLAFTVHVTEDDQEARVDDVMLTSSTLHLHEVEACMTDALYGMQTPLEALALRRRTLSPDPTVAPEARALLGQAQVVSLLEVMAVVIVGYALYTVVVHIIVDKPRTKPRPRPAPPVVTEEPAVTAEPVMTGAPIASAAPTATAVPIATATPVATYVPMTPKTDYEEECKPFFNRCLGNMRQPKWNRKKFGDMKDCGACYRLCKNHARGQWPRDKCPDE